MDDKKRFQRVRSKGDIKRDLIIRGCVENPESFVCPHCGCLVGDPIIELDYDDDIDIIEFKEMQCETCFKKFKGEMEIRIITRSFVTDGLH